MRLYRILIGIFFLFCVLLFPSKTYAAFSFTVPETTITKDTELNANVNLSLQGQGNKIYYLEGAFKNETSSNYFGLTWNDSSWVNYTASNFTALKSITTDSTGNWSGSVKAKIDSGSSLFIGDGTYTLRFKRFTTGGSSSWSDNTITLNVVSSTPTPTPTPSPSPTPTSTPPLTSGSSSSSSFTISNIPAQINSDQSFDITINLSLPDNPNTNFYLKGAFRHPDKPSNYFGLTKVGSSWVKNSSTYTNQYKITTNSSGNWSGNLEIKPDANDSGFIGSGEYLFKVARYEGSNLTWSNESNIQITAVENTDQGDISLDSSSSTTAPLSSPQSEQSAKNKAASSQSKSYDKQSLPSREGRLVYHTASVAAATVLATPSATTEVKSQKQVNYFNWVGVLMILSGIALFAFVYLRSRNLREAIFNIFRKRN